ncbi:MAG TPA: hypothetical protein VMU34_05180 [Mycobacterium sp.]|nr:hypothetical protein [Mycobacterium sp.]
MPADVRLILAVLDAARLTGLHMRGGYLSPAGTMWCWYTIAAQLESNGSVSSAAQLDYA